MINDKQRTYIEILKQTLQSNLLQNGIQLNPSMTEIQLINSLSEIIDINKINNEKENIRKELTKANMIITDLKNNIDSLKKSNNDILNINTQLKSKYDNEKRNKDLISAQLENEISKQKTLNNQIQSLQEHNHKIQMNLTQYQTICLKYENQIYEHTRKINELKNEINSYENLYQKYSENKVLYENLNKSNKYLSKEKEKLEQTLRDSQTQITELKNKQSELYKQIASNEEKHQKEKKNLLEQNEQIHKTYSKLDNTINDTKLILHNKEQELLKFQELLIENEKQNIKLTNQIDENTKQFKKSQNEAMTEIEILQSNKNELTSQLNHIKQLYNDIQTQFQDMSDENLKMKTQLNLLEIEKEKILNENTEIKLLLDNSRKNDEIKNIENLQLNENNMKFKQEHTSLINELSFWKDKYNKDIQSQINEIKILKDTINNLNLQLENISRQNTKITNENTSLKNECQLKQQIININNNQNSLYTILQNCIEIIIINIDKILAFNKDNYNINFYSSTFINYIHSLYTLSSNKNLNHLDKLQTIKSFLEEIIREHFNLINNYLNLSEQNKLLNNNNLSLHNNITNFANNIHKAHLYIESNENKLKQVNEDNLTYRQSNNDLIHEINVQRNEMEKITCKLHEINFQKKVIENKYEILIKEKKMYNKILNYICKVSTMKNVANVIKDLIKVINDISDIEKKKMKINNDEISMNEIERKLDKKNKELNLIYEVFQREMEMIVKEKVNELTYRHNNHYYKRGRNLNISNSVCAFSPLMSYMNNNRTHRALNSDIDKYIMFNSGEF